MTVIGPGAEDGAVGRSGDYGAMARQSSSPNPSTSSSEGGSGSLSRTETNPAWYRPMFDVDGVSELPLSRSYSGALVVTLCDRKDGSDHSITVAGPAHLSASGNYPFECSSEDDEARHCHEGRRVVPDYRARRKLIIASILCVIFMVGEVIGGYFANSLAIATDAAHLLSDFASFMISLFALWMAHRPPTKKMSFGWYRAEVVGALASILLIWVVTGVLVYIAIERIIHMNFEINALIMLITSGAGVIINLIMGCALHQHGHGSTKETETGGKVPVKFTLAEETTQLLARKSGGHTHGLGSHGHSHKNLNVRAAFIHVLGDLIQSLGVFMAAIIIYFQPTWIIIDPICTFFFSIIVLLTTFAIMKDTLQVLMEGLPKGVNFNEVHDILINTPGVVRVHNLRIWALSMDKAALSAHLAVRKSYSPHDILKEASCRIRKYYDFFEITLQIEEYKESMKDCNECDNPPH